MPQRTHHSFWRSLLLPGSAIGVSLFVWQITALAQSISTDGTLGPVTTLTGPTYIIRQNLGRTVGHNLFHSFRQFNLNTGETALFQSSPQIQNILSRVTGGSASLIDGLIKTQGSNANLFLINPQGIVFGANARLDVGGSFVATTAHSLKFPDGSEFSATNPQAPPMLSINLSPGLQYGTRQGAIANAGQLSVPAGKTLTLLGKTVSSTGRLVAPGGRIEVLGERVALLDRATIDVSAPGGGGTVLLGGDFQGKGTVPNAQQTFVAPNVSIRADAIGTGNGGTVIVWSDQSTRFYGNISARGGDRGGNGGLIEVSGKTNLDYQGFVNAGARQGAPGTFLLDPTNIEIVASGGDTSNLSDVDDPTDPNLSGNVTRLNVAAINNAQANVVLQATNDIIFNAPIDIQALGVGLTAEAGNNILINNNIAANGGNLIFQAQNGVFATGVEINSNKNDNPLSSFTLISGLNQVDITNSIIRSRTFNNATTKSDASAVGIVSRNGSVNLNDVNISATNFGPGLAGDVVITARDRVDISNSGIFSRGNQGRILIGKSTYVDLSPKAIGINNSLLKSDNDIQVAAGTRLDAGDISLIAKDTLDVLGSSITSSTYQLGNPGLIFLSTDNGAVTIGSSVIQTRIESSGIAQLTSDNAFAGGVFNALLGQSETKIVGSTFISTGSLTVDNSDISATTFGTGNAGAVVVLASGDVTLSNGGAIFSRSGVDNNGQPARGNAGGIIIGSGSSVRIEGYGSGLTTETEGVGDAGAILVFADDRISIDGRGSGIFSSVLSATPQLGGFIGLTSRSLVLKNGAEINVNNEGSGEAGAIFISGLATFLDRNSRISATTRSGRGGDIALNVAILSLYRSSSILTDADTARLSGGIQPGGNISIRGIPKFGFDRTLAIAAKPGRDSNIVAKAFKGRGGNIDIFAGRLLGIRQRPEVASTNDIDASSDFGANGFVTISVIDIDPERGTVQLADDLADASRLIAEGCDTRGKLALGRFTSTGRGGLPPSPSDTLTGDDVLTSWVTVKQSTAQAQSPVPQPSTTLDPAEIPASSPTEIVEAQGWEIDSDGSVVLVAQAPEATPQIPWLQSGTCKARY